MAGNPFSDQPGSPPPRLAGRDAELTSLLDVIQRVEDGGPASLFIEGARGLGKASLLAETAQEAAKRGLVVVRVELTGDDAEATTRILDAVGRAMGATRLRDLAARVSGLRVGPVGVDIAAAPAPGASITSLLAAVVKAHAEQGVLVLVDEAQEHPQLAAAIVAAGHRAAQDGAPLGVVYAGLPRMPEAIVAVSSYAERIRRHALSGLGQDATWEAISGPLEAGGFVLSVSRKGQLHALTGGYPHFVQIYGRCLWGHAADGAIDGPGWNAAVTDATSQADSWMTSRLARLSDRQREYLEVATELGWPARTGAVAEHLGRSAQSVTYLRDALIAEGLVYATRHGEIDLTVGPMQRWLRRDP